jgi:molybdopterin/thiamine biosynthesis adenylyltransferase
MIPGDGDRYSRQIRLPEIGEAGQQAISAARVAIVGVGALGSFQAMALARAGAGYLRLIDRDYVEWNNLQRQWVFEESDAAEGLPKAPAAARRLARVNSAVRCEPVVADLDPGNAGDLLGGIELILDGSDNFETRYLINDCAVRDSTPWIYGAAVGSYGIAMPVVPGATACLRCLYPEPPAGSQPTCETAGVLNTVTSAVASWQVSLALRLLVAGRGAVAARITTFDGWTASARSVDQPPPRSDCPCCGERRFVHLEGARRAPISLCGRNAVQIHERRGVVDLAALGSRLRPLGAVRANEFALRFSHDPYELTVFADGRTIVKGTTDPGVARSLYARFVGN